MTRRGFILAFAAMSMLGSAAAQIPPSSQEAAASGGLHAAAFRGDVGEISRLLAGGADVGARDTHRRTALHVAAHGGHWEAAQALLAGGADPNAKDVQRYDIITIVAVRDDVVFLQRAIAHGADAKAITSPYDGTALIAAAHLGHDEVVATLIKAGAPLDHVNNLGWTALIEAIVLGDGGPRHVRCVKLLVEAGADPNIADRQGRTPLALARARGFGAMVDIIAGRGGR
jgi:ankyrin repeat protein